VETIAAFTILMYQLSGGYMQVADRDGDAGVVLLGDLTRWPNPTWVGLQSGVYLVSYLTYYANDHAQGRRSIESRWNGIASAAAWRSFCDEALRRTKPLPGKPTHRRRGDGNHWGFVTDSERATFRVQYYRDGRGFTNLNFSADPVGGVDGEVVRRIGNELVVVADSATRIGNKAVCDATDTTFGDVGASLQALYSDLRGGVCGEEVAEIVNAFYYEASGHDLAEHISATWRPQHADAWSPTELYVLRKVQRLAYLSPAARLRLRESMRAAEYTYLTKEETAKLRQECKPLFARIAAAGVRIAQTIIKGYDRHASRK
jgi:hypothetical protein